MITGLLFCSLMSLGCFLSFCKFFLQISFCFHVSLIDVLIAFDSMSSYSNKLLFFQYALVRSGGARIFRSKYTD